MTSDTCQGQLIQKWVSVSPDRPCLKDHKSTGVTAGKNSPFDTEIGNSARKPRAKRLPGCVTITINSKRKIAHATSDLRC